MACVGHLLNRSEFLAHFNALTSISFLESKCASFSPIIQCGLASVDLKRCYFFQDCPRHLPSLFPSLRFAEPLGPLDALPHALRSHFGEVGASVRAERSARRTRALAAAAAKEKRGTRAR